MNLSNCRRISMGWAALGALHLLPLGGGCRPAAQSAVSRTAVSPAKATRPVSESDLNTIELTAEAVQRLGLETRPVEERAMPRQRPYGADVVLPTGSAVIVSAPLAGTLQHPDGKQFPQVGQHVQEGDPLLGLLPLLSPERAVLTPAERIRFAGAKNAVARSQNDAEAQVQQATVQLDAARIAFERADRLLKEKAGTVRAVDEAQAQAQLAEKALEAARIRKKLVDGISFDEEAGALQPLTIRSPLTGIVRTTAVQPGQIVAAGAVLFEVMNADHVWIKVPVYVGEVDEIDAAQPARLTLLDGRTTDHDLVATPVSLPPTALPLTAAVDLYYELENKSHAFRPGQKVAAHLPLKGEARRTALPWAAVIHDIYGSQWVYEQIGERKYARRRVEVAWVSGEWAATVRGPALGAQVVTAGAAELAGTEFGIAK